MKKCCKIIPVFFGPRRKFDFNEEDTIELMDFNIQNEINAIHGDDLCVDVIIVNNSPEYKTAKEFLNSYNNHKTKSGKIIVIEGDNIGMSYGAFNFAFQKFKNQYDYWFFTEDDVIFNLDGYYEKAINQLDSDDKLAFIACFGVGGGNTSRRHAHHGAGCTHTKYLNEATSFNGGGLPYYKDYLILGEKCNVNNHCEEGEVSFTNIYHKMNYRIEKLVSNERPFIKWFDDRKPGRKGIVVKEWGSVDYGTSKKFKPIGEYARWF